jgi:hypothetical protein
MIHYYRLMMVLNELFHQATKTKIKEIEEEKKNIDFIYFDITFIGIN